MAILKSKAKLTEPFVGKKEVIVMLSVQDGQSTASATKLDYDAVHTLEQMIIDLTFTPDTPHSKISSCKECEDYADCPDADSDVSRHCGRQIDCKTCKRYTLGCELPQEICEPDPITEVDCGWGKPE